MSVKKSDPEAVREDIATPAAPPMPSAGGSYTLVDDKLVLDAPEPDASDVMEV